MKLFSIRVYSVAEKKKKGRRVVALFKSIFSRNWSLSNARWFYGKKCKIEKGIPYLTENQLGKNELWCATLAIAGPTASTL